MKNQNSKILLFDGECNLCNRTVQFIIKSDKKVNITFASLQSEVGKKLMKDKMIPESYSDSIVFIDHDKVYFKSTAALRICLYLSALWPLLYVFVIIPDFIRNYIYDFVAKRRFKWFGKTTTCWVMTPELKERFL